MAPLVVTYYNFEKIYVKILMSYTQTIFVFIALTITIISITRILIYIVFYSNNYHLCVFLLHDSVLVSWQPQKQYIIYCSRLFVTFVTVTELEKTLSTVAIQYTLRLNFFFCIFILNGHITSVYYICISYICVTIFLYINVYANSRTCLNYI